MLSVYWQYKKWACTWWYMHEGIQLWLSKKLGQCPFLQKKLSFRQFESKIKKRLKLFLKIKNIYVLQLF